MSFATRLGLCAALLSGCNKEKAVETDDDLPDGAECTFDEDCDTHQLCEDATCVYGDRDSLEEPQEILLESPTEQLITPPGDVDYFSYDSPGAEWIRINTETLGDRTNNVDTVVTVRRSNGATHAWMNDYATGPVSGFDTVFYVYLPTSGEWLIEVQDASTFYPDVFDKPRGDETFEYTLEVVPFNFASDPDSPEDPLGTITVESDTTTWAYGFVIKTAGDVDHLDIDLSFGGRYLDIREQPNIEGSSLETLVRLYDPYGIQVGEKEYGNGEYLTLFDTTAGLHSVEVTDASGAGSDEAWTVLYVRTYPVGEHPFFSTEYENEEEPNNEALEATALSGIADGSDSSFRLDGTILDADDEDWFAFDVETGQYTAVRCWTHQFGSLAMIDVALIDDAGTELEFSDVDTVSYYLWGVENDSNGTNYFRVRPLNPVYGAISFYRCAIFQTTELVGP